MSVDKIYLVVGETGEYSDHTQWNVAAYVDKEAAEQHKRLAQDFLETADSPYADIKSPYDNYKYLWSKGTKYYVEEIAVVRHVDEYQERYPVK
jgi:cytochrome c